MNRKVEKIARIMDFIRFAHTLRAQIPGGAETEVPLALGATTSEAIKALCRVMGLEEYVESFALFLSESTGIRILQTSDRPLELYLQRTEALENSAPFLLRRMPHCACNRNLAEDSPYVLFAVSQGTEDFMHLPVCPSEERVLEFAALRLLIDGEPLCPGSITRNLDRYIHPAIRSMHTTKDWDILVLSHIKTKGYSATKSHQQFLEFIDEVEAVKMSFFEAMYFPSKDSISVFLAIDPFGLNIYDRSTHDNIAFYPLYLVHSWTIDEANSRLIFHIVDVSDSYALLFSTVHAFAVVSLLRYYIARLLEQNL